MFVKNCVDSFNGLGMNKDIEIFYFIVLNLNGFILFWYKYYEIYWELCWFVGKENYIFEF